MSDPAADLAYASSVHANLRDLMARIGEPRTPARAVAIARVLEIEAQRLRVLAARLRHDKEPDPPR